jgi:hypothetical protein
MEGQGEQRPAGVVSARRDFHGPMLPGGPWRSAGPCDGADRSLDTVPL